MRRPFREEHLVVVPKIFRYICQLGEDVPLCPVSRVPCPVSCRSNAVEFLHVKWKDLIEIVCAYKRPQKTLAAFICELEPVLKILLGKRSIICGDFNVNLLTDNDN